MMTSPLRNLSSKVNLTDGNCAEKCLRPHNEVSIYGAERENRKHAVVGNLQKYCNDNADNIQQIGSKERGNVQKLNMFSVAGKGRENKDNVMQ